MEKMSNKDPNRIRARKNLLAWRITVEGSAPSECSKIFCRRDGDRYRWYYEDGETTGASSPASEGLEGAKAVARQAWSHCDISGEGVRYQFHTPGRRADRKVRLLWNWAPHWKTTQPPTKEALKDASWAEFEDDSGNCIRVRITAQELKDFGQVPSQLQQKGRHTEQVLRAILETYVTKHGVPSREIDAEDLGSDLATLKLEFTRRNP
jgi:hypothetical protein